MRVWDLRAPQSVGMFGVLDPGSGLNLAHGGMVTSVDAMGDMVISAGRQRWCGAHGRKGLMHSIGHMIMNMTTKAAT